MLLLHLSLLLPPNVLLVLFIQLHGKSSFQLGLLRTEVFQLLLLLLILSHQLLALRFSHSINHKNKLMKVITFGVDGTSSCRCLVLFMLVSRS